jgi:hypothetical protein
MFDPPGRTIRGFPVLSIKLYLALDFYRFKSGNLFFSAMIAVVSIYIHIQFLRDYWQIWTYQLKYWYGFSVFLQIVFVTTFIACIILGIYYKQSKH